MCETCRGKTAEELQITEHQPLASLSKLERRLRAPRTSSNEGARLVQLSISGAVEWGGEARSVISGGGTRAETPMV
jgi:hypothetical protein